MSVVEFIIIAFALSFEALIVMHGCALQSPLKLTKGLAEAFVMAVENALLLLAGMALGNFLRFTPDGMAESGTRELLSNTDNLVYLGLLLLVALRLLFRSGKKRRQVQPYDISKFSTAMLLGIAVGINSLLVGLALGFRMPLGENLWRAAVPLVAVMTLLGLLGTMLGRQQREVRAARYTLIAALLILVFALKGAFWS